MAKVLSDSEARRLAMNIAGMLPTNHVMRARVLEYLARVVPFLDGEIERPTPKALTNGSTEAHAE